jgi:hypothetical protein
VDEACARTGLVHEQLLQLGVEDLTREFADGRREPGTPPGRAPAGTLASPPNRSRGPRTTCRRPEKPMTPAERKRFTRWWVESRGLTFAELREIAAGLALG